MTFFTIRPERAELNLQKNSDGQKVIWVELKFYLFN